MLEKIKRYLFTDEPLAVPWAAIRKFVLDNPAVSVTLCYVLLVCMGLIYNVSLFSRFGINILDYSDKEDFLFAGIKNPNAIITGLSLSLLLLLYRKLALSAKKLKSRVLRFISLYFTWIGLLRSEILIVLAVFYFFFGFYYTARFEADRFLRGSRSQRTAFILMETKKGTITHHEIIPIGATKNYILGIDCSPKLLAAQAIENTEGVSLPIKVLPFSQITSIEYRTEERSSTVLPPVKNEGSVRGACDKSYDRRQ